MLSITKYKVLNFFPPLSHILPNGTLIPKIPVFKQNIQIKNINAIYIIEYNVIYNKKYIPPKNVIFYNNTYNKYDPIWHFDLTDQNQNQQKEKGIDIFSIPIEGILKLIKLNPYYCRSWADEDFTNKNIIGWKSPESIPCIQDTTF